jgi:ATP:ADP antiporter, AAA family
MLRASASERRSDSALQNPKKFSREIWNRMNPAKRTFDNHSRELFVLLCVCFAAAILGDNAAEALLLAHISPSLLPRMFLINACALFLASASIISLIDRIDRGALFLCVTFGHAVMILLVRWTLETEVSWLYPVLFSYAYIVKILLFLLFWTLANDLIDSRSAQKRFPVIAAGGTLGAIAGALTVPGMVRMFAAENLLFVWSALSLTLGLLFISLRIRAGKSFKPSSDRERHCRKGFSLAADLKPVMADPLLSGMACVYGIVFFLLIVQHYFFYIAIKSYFASAERIASFLGFFSGASMAATLILQLSVAGAVLRRFGSGRAILLLPFALMLLFISQAIASGNGPASVSYILFVTIVVAMGVRIAVFDAFFSPNFQLFFSSLPQEMRGRAKVALEGVIKPSAILLAGLWLIGVAPRLTFAVNMSVCVLCAALLFVLTLRLKERYAESLLRFLSGISGRSLPAGIVRDGAATSLIKRVRHLFEEGDFEIRAFLMEELALSGAPELVSFVAEQARREDARIRATAVAALGGALQPGIRELICARLHDDDARVVANAVTALGRHGGADVVPLLEPFLSHPHARVRSNAVVALWKAGGRAHLPLFREPLERMLHSERPEECASALFALGEIDVPEAGKMVLAFTGTNEWERARKAHPLYRQLVIALSKKNDPACIDVLLTLAEEANRTQRREIVAALASMVEKGAPPGDLVTRAANRGQRCSLAVVKSLYESRVRLPMETRRSLRALVRDLCAATSGMYDSLEELLPYARCAGVALFRQVLVEERIAVSEESMVYALSLLDDSNSVRPVVPLLFHYNPHIRGRAFEVLGAKGDTALNREVMNILDRRGGGGGEDGDRNVTPQRDASLSRLLSCYLSDADSWIRKCAAFALEGFTAAERGGSAVSCI